jgi:hypothetical protein
MSRRKAPEIIDVPAEELEGIKSRISSCGLLEQDKKIVLAILGSYSWLLRQFQSTKFTIHRLKKMFGFSTEKHSKLRAKNSTGGATVDFSTEGTSASAALSLGELQGLAKQNPEKK